MCDSCRAGAWGRKAGENPFAHVVEGPDSISSSCRSPSPSLGFLSLRGKRSTKPLPQTTLLRPIFRNKDFSDCMMNREYFLKYSQTYGPFDLDGVSDNDGVNSSVAEDFCCPASPFQERDLH
jgi:hypothetical protein